MAAEIKPQSFKTSKNGTIFLVKLRISSKKSIISLLNARILLTVAHICVACGNSKNCSKTKLAFIRFCLTIKISNYNVKRI